VVKIGPVDPEIALLEDLLKKKLTEAEHIDLGACKPFGLNKETRQLKSE